MDSQQSMYRMLIDDDDEFEMMAPGALYSVLKTGDNLRQQQLVAHRQPRRRYLVREDLPPNPRMGTPAQRLLQAKNSRAYITTMGCDVATFEYLLQAGFEHTWNSTPIPREDVSARGAPRMHMRSLDARGALALALHFICSSMHERGLQQIFALTPAVCSRYLDFALDILLEVVRGVSEGEVSWWKDEQEFIFDAELIRTRHPRLKSAIGSIDGLSLTTAAAGDPEVENASYNLWKADHRTSNVLVFSPQGVIRSAVLNAPGSWHDSKVSRKIYQQLEDETPGDYYLVADSAFPRAPNAIKDRIRRPLKSGERLPSDPTEETSTLAFNRALLSYRQTAEWGMRALQGAFARLRVPLDVNDSRRRLRLLELCVRLHNIRTIRVGANQIRSVYMPEWEAADDDGFWEDVGDMLFRDVRKFDRVSRFHLVVVDDD